MLKKIVKWAAIALVLYFVCTQPIAAAGDTHTILGWLLYGAEQIVTFLVALFT